MNSSSIEYRQLKHHDKPKLTYFINQQLNTIPEDYFYPPSSQILSKALSNTSGLSYGAFLDGRLI